MEEVTKCRYIDCVDTREKEQILHELPVCDTGLCVRWLINSGHVDLIGSDLDALRSMKFFVCNNHFTEDCYLSKGTLKENAVPSPHWSTISRTLRNLKTRRKVQLNGQESSMEEVATDQLKEKNAPSEFEVDQWCRTCASKKQNLVSMTTKGKGTDMSLLSKLKLLIEIDDEDALPTKMCDECVDKLEQSFKFFQQIYVADNTLRHVFPNTRSSNTPRKPLYSIGEHMRNEQKEKQKEKEKEEEQQQQVQDRAPKITRGIFRRGRGRPRTRGYAARARARQRSAQIAISISNSNVNDNTTYETRVNEATTLKNESQSVISKDEERHGDTVFSLLTDTCHSDEELDWSDVLKVMNDHRYQTVPKQEIETKLEEKTEKKIVEQVIEPEMMLQAETVSETSGMEMKTEMGSEVKVEIETQSDATKSIAEHEIQRIHCEFCNESFKLRRQLQTHLLSNHSQLSGYMCIDCLTCYENESLLSKHRSLRHGNRIYRCEHCHEEFLEKRVLREHINKCEMHDRTNYSCDSCGLTFASKQELIGHMENHPENSVVSFHKDHENSQKAENELVSSSKTTIEFEAESEYSSIISSNIVGISESNNSDEKTKSVINSSNTCKVNATEETEEGATIGEESVPTCPDCNEQMQDTVELSIHRMRRHSMNRKDATCLLCDNKTFSSLDEYEQHVLDHCKRLRISP
ncbi:PR domain zinc finger protein 14 [Eufriesea mexicana]|uniref:transcription factor E4F1-like n=1 Tax=Eufriesea mexicana TaxID=516756 RepID=UPI00083BE191|nr:PREDICTED: transcription factor E4F1-like [Eufriesea mexicana]OAD59547.1 PR domain zinc finger protein 14 [Eufriesea mexicana]